MENSKQKIIHTLWTNLNGNSSELSIVQFHGPESVFPSRFDVTSFSSSAVAVANLAVAEFHSLRFQKSLSNYAVDINTIEASGSFKSDSLLKPLDFKIPAPWDAFAGDYECSDHWIRLHTNYAYHLQAVFKVLGTQSSKEDLAKILLTKKASEIESAVVEASGCAAIMYDRETWRKHEHGKFTLDEKTAVLNYKKEAEFKIALATDQSLALSGIKVLDLTRVLAGPTCTKFLSAYGAEVLRVDPPGFQEVQALIPDVTVGKKCAFLDIKSEKEIFKKLIAESHILVCGLRADALSRLGFNEEEIYSINPNLIFVTLNAYGSKGPWKNRRGFDSLVQMSSGITHAGMSYKKANKPTPLPFQALDYAAGYLMAAGVCRALSELLKNKKLYHVSASLIGASNLLQEYVGDFEIPMPETTLFDQYLIDSNTAWGKCKRFKVPGIVSGLNPRWAIDAGELGAFLF